MESTAYPLMIEPEELNASLADPSLLIVDLCRTEQYHSAHIPGAVHLPFMHLMGGYVLNTATAMLRLVRSVQLTFYCVERVLEILISCMHVLSTRGKTRK